MNEYIAIIIIVIIVLIYFSLETECKISPKTIHENGFLFYKHESNMDHLSPLQKQDKIKLEILSKLPDGYVFLDYYYYIKGCSLSTYHRDVTSGQRYMKSNHPTYTVIIYEYDGDFLSLCPNSHKQFPFIYSRPVYISGKKNTVVLFNSDILHSGIINRIGDARKVIQYKVVHQDDLHLFDELNDVKIEKSNNCNNNLYLEHVFRQISLHSAWFLNGIVYPLTQRRYSDNTIFSSIQDRIPLSFYNNI